jgi:hypothetical protein
MSSVAASSRQGYVRSVIEILTFRLRPGVDEADFLAVDSRVQTAFRYQQRGLVRSTTARGSDGRWLVLQVWADEESADAARERWRTDALGAEFDAMIDDAGVARERFTALD